MRWIVRLFVALVACVLVAVGLLFMLPTDKIGQLASDQLKRQTGRTLTLSGAFKPTLYPVLGVKTGPITISNAEWASDPLMISALGATVGVNLAALMGGDVQIETLELVSPVVFLERAKDGRVNWEFSPIANAPSGSANSGAGGATTPPSLDLGRITNGRVVFADRAAGITHELTAINGTVSLPKGASSAAIDMAAIVDGHAGALMIDIGDWQNLLASGESAVEGTVTVGDANFGLKGTVGLGNTLPSIQGAFKASFSNPATFAKNLGIATPTQLLSVGTLALNGQIQMEQSGLFLDTAFDGTFENQPFSGKINLTGADDWLNKPEFAADLNVSIADAGSLHFNGRAGQGRKTLVSGDLRGTFNNLRKVMALVGASPETPKGTFQTGMLLGEMQLSQSGKFSLSGARIAVDKNAVSGDISVSFAMRPFIEANLTADALDLSPFTAENGGGSGSTGSASDGGASSSGWSKDPITLKGLGAVDADVSLTANSINLGVSQLGKTAINAKLRDGLLTLKLQDVRVFKGAITGKINLRGGNIVAFDTNITARDVQLEPLLGQLLDIDRLRGSGTTNLALKGRGQSLHQIMTSLSGTGDVKFADGAIKGIDLGAMMRNLKSAFGGFEGATEFSSLTGTFSMEKGVLQNVDLSLISPLFKAAGKGSVDVGGQAMNYVVTPTSLSKDAEFSVPVFITGPWQNLKFRPDLDKILNLLLNTKLKDNAEVQKAKAKLDAAKAELKDPETAVKNRLKKELAKKAGTEPDPSKSLEDQAKDAVGNALKKLFD
jgi:uncharacterized protein involved in outer membrane biogenesis